MERNGNRAEKKVGWKSHRRLGAGAIQSDHNANSKLQRFGWPLEGGPMQEPWHEPFRRCIALQATSSLPAATRNLRNQLEDARTNLRSVNYQCCCPAVHQKWQQESR
jgi:hypothetical protein